MVLWRDAAMIFYLVGDSNQVSPAALTLKGG